MKILISGYYGYGNLGDEALLQGLCSGLHAQGHQLTLLSSNPAASRALHAAHSHNAVHRYRALLPALLRHEVLISGGGGLLQDKTSRRSLRYYLGVIRLAKWLGKRVIVYGQSVGPLSPWGRQQVASALQGVAVAVRDQASQRLLASLGIKSALCADSALLLPAPIRTGSRAERERVLLVPRGGYPDITDALCSLAQRLHEAHIPLAAVALQPQIDADAIAALQQAVPSLTEIPADNLESLLREFAASRHVISVRLHGLILAAVARCTFSGVVYDPKVAAFLADAGLPAYHLPLDYESLSNEIFHPVYAQEKIALLKTRAQQGLLWLEQQLQA